MTQPYGLPEKQGLYNPEHEHDACGVGFIANINGKKTHAIVSDALQILDNLTHRGACGCDPDTGDGAGILTQIPHEFFAHETKKLGIELPDFGDYGIGMVFLPTDETDREKCRIIIETITADEGQEFLGWRDVPVNPNSIGPIARDAAPFIAQFFIKKVGHFSSFQDWERKLYLIRKRSSFRISNAEDIDSRQYYVCSLSSQTIIYKGMLISYQMKSFFHDLNDERFVSALGLVHSRFSTNTFPTWDLAHPYRMIAHNGEINTLRGNRNWMKARTATIKHEYFGDKIAEMQPLVNDSGSDSATFDNALEFFVMGGRSLAHAVMMMVPEAWSGDPNMDPDKRAFYEYHACLMEPWDGPAAICFTDGNQIGATLDRNGLRPGRYWITKDNQIIFASESGVLERDIKDILYKGKMQPGKMLLVDLNEGRIIGDEELKGQISLQQNYREWIESNVIELEHLPVTHTDTETDLNISEDRLARLHNVFGYTLEDLKILLSPMYAKGEEAIGSMGTDTPLAVLSDRPQLLFHYFKQLFAQVTNPPIDSIREEMVMSSYNYLGTMHNILDETAEHCRLVRVKHVVLTNDELAKIRNVKSDDFRSITLSAVFKIHDGEAGLEKALERLFSDAEDACRNGYNIIILSDKDVDENHAPIPSLLATAGVHHYLIQAGVRGSAGIIVETGEAREVMHFALLIGYGAGAVNPYLAFETAKDMIINNSIPAEYLGEEQLTYPKAVKHYVKAVDKAILKIIAKMGISTVQSYQGAQIFEAIGLNKSFIDKYFTNTASRIEGVGIEAIARESVERHRRAWPEDRTSGPEILDVGGQYHWRRRGEHHLFNPDTVFKLQHSTRTGDYKVFKEYTKLVDDQSKRLATLRGLFKFKQQQPVPLEEVEPVSSIIKRFATGAMSLGSISTEAHETLAIAMNRIGGKSNTGEGGEDPRRFKKDANGDNRRSAIKQVASGRFGVTINYLQNSDEIQIKMAQGAKPGEGGQLPGHKVDKYIGWLRYATPGVGLISPPPHHDIYSIEDLAQLIHDLKNANPRARISVKLVSEVGVGTIAAGVSKAHADHVLISGHDGGTGASPLTSIKHAGAPWELGLAETHQVLVMNGLRNRIYVQCDGQLKTGRDVAIATLLGAEEWGCATAPLVASGCIMMRKCHLNTCPVGIATQDPILRAKFDGKPEYVVNFFHFLAEELREIMAQLGFRTVEEMVGRSDILEMNEAINHWKCNGLDFSAIFYRPEEKEYPEPRYRVLAQDHGLDGALDNKLIELSSDALEAAKPVTINLPIKNINRSVGTMLSGELAKRYGSDGLPDNTISINLDGSAGQSFGAFLGRGISLTITGDANDYVGKGLSGGRIVIRTPEDINFRAEENIIIGNTCLYGATSGELFARGLAGERFAVRNSGALCVVEGVGDHGCEYMTGGYAVILGKTGRNFAAGMSGGIAFVFDEDGKFETRCNKALVDLEEVQTTRDIEDLKQIIERHVTLTGSTRGAEILAEWESNLKRFVKVMPRDYKLALRLMEEEQQKAEREMAGSSL